MTMMGALAAPKPFAVSLQSGGTCRKEMGTTGSPEESRVWFSRVEVVSSDRVRYCVWLTVLKTVTIYSCTDGNVLTFWGGEGEESMDHEAMAVMYGYHVTNTSAFL